MAKLRENGLRYNSRSKVWRACALYILASTLETGGADHAKVLTKNVRELRNFCRDCRYDYRQTTGQRLRTSLYWDFLDLHRGVVSTTHGQPVCAKKLS